MELYWCMVKECTSHVLDNVIYNADLHNVIQIIEGTCLKRRESSGAEKTCLSFLWNLSVRTKVRGHTSYSLWESWPIECWRRNSFTMTLFLPNALKRLVISLLSSSLLWLCSICELSFHSYSHLIYWTNRHGMPIGGGGYACPPCQHGWLHFWLQYQSD